MAAALALLARDGRDADLQAGPVLPVARVLLIYPSVKVSCAHAGCRLLAP